MRQWINLFEGHISPERLQEIARDLLEINDDIIPDHMIEDFDASEAQCLAIIERCFHSADCDNFAYVCQQLTGDQPYWIGNGFAHHTVCSTSDQDGELYDVTGIVTLEEICRRYKFKNPDISEGSSHFMDDEDDYTRALIIDSIRYLKQIGRKPFTSFPV